MKHDIILLGILILFLFLFHTAQARVWYVHPDSTLNSIQDCLDSCDTGDTVLVGPGTYYENIVWPNTHGIDLISELGPDITIIDGDSAGTVIACTIWVDSTTKIKGFTIKNGYGSGYWGGGIYCLGATPIISNNIISNNTGNSGGGLLLRPDLNPDRLFIIINNVITNNTATHTGGGIDLAEPAPPFNYKGMPGKKGKSATADGNLLQYYLTIKNNIIINNTAPFGAGIFCSESAPLIIGNTIIGNIADSGGAIYCYEACPIIDSCNILNNFGDGFYLVPGWWFPSEPVIHYNNIAGNSGFGIRNLDTVWCDAVNNWWGDSTGPYHPGSNPGGLGDSVSDNVDFVPWLREPVVIGIKEEKALQKSSPAIQLQPNPFKNKVLIGYQLSKISNVNIVIYDLTGKKIRTLVSSKQNIGIYAKSWDGRDNLGKIVSSGVYFLRFKTENYTTSKRLLKIR